MNPKMSKDSVSKSISSFNMYRTPITLIERLARINATGNTPGYSCVSHEVHNILALDKHKTAVAYSAFFEFWGRVHYDVSHGNLELSSTDFFITFLENSVQIATYLKCTPRQFIRLRMGHMTDRPHNSGLRVTRTDKKATQSLLNINIRFTFQ